MRKLIISSVLLSFLFVMACGDKTENTVNPPISEIPRVTIEKIEPLEVQQFESVYFEISYIDGDGDIGTEDADDHSLEILDARDNILHTFHVPPQSPTSGIVIQGVLTVELENVILLDQSNDFETIEYSVRLKDRDGNWSQSVVGQTVTVSK